MPKSGVSIRDKTRSARSKMAALVLSRSRLRRGQPMTPFRGGKEGGAGLAAPRGSVILGTGLPVSSL